MSIEETYNVLWIDDEHEFLTGLKLRAKKNSINLFPHKSMEKGIGELENNYQQYDAVLLDAKFFENEHDSPGTEDTKAAVLAYQRIQKIPKAYEILVLTGQAEAYDGEMFKKMFPRVYKKGLDEDIEKLFNDLKLAAKNQPEAQIRNKYKRVFDVCNDKYIGERTGSDLLRNCFGIIFKIF